MLLLRYRINLVKVITLKNVNHKKLYIIILGLLILTSKQLFAQDSKFDSLFIQLNSYPKVDTNYINTLSAIAMNYQHRNMDSMLLIGNRVLKLSEDLKYTHGLGNGHKIKGIAYINLMKYDEALYHDSIALYYFKKINDVIGIGSVYNNMAVLFNVFGEFNSANIYYSKSIEYWILTNNLKGLGDCYANIGNNLVSIGDYNGALQNMLKGLVIQKQINNQEGMAITYGNLGNIYYFMRDLKKAENSYMQSLRIKLKTKSEFGLSMLYINLGALQYELNNFDTANYYFSKALKLAKKNGDKESLIMVYSNIAEMAMLKHKYNEAIIAINESEKYITTNIDYEGKVEFNLRKSTYFFAIKNYPEAIKYCTIAYNTSLKIEALPLISETAQLLSKIYENSGNAINALKYFKISKQYSDSVYNEDNLTKFKDFEYKYNLQNKEQEILKLETSQKIAQEKNNVLKIAFALLVVLLIGISLLTYSINANRRKEKKINDLTFKQHDILEQHSKFKDKIFSIIAHDLRSPVASLQSMFNLLNSGLITTEEFLNLKTDMNNQVNTLSLLLENLLIWAKNQMKTGLQTNKNSVSLNKLITQNKQLFNEIADKKEVSVETVINEEIHLIADTDQLDLIIRNLLSNAIKFTNKKGTVSIIANQTNDKVELKIKDTGIGMDKLTIEKIYANNVVSKKGTDGEHGTGLGLSLTKEFIENNNGTMSIDSTPNIGTEITITFNKI